MTHALQCITNQSLSVGNLASYTHWTQQFPMLSRDEEQDLAHELIENNDVEAARKLVMSHLRFVIKIARGYNGYGLAQEDLIQEGNIGLMKAVRRFDPKVGVRLVSFAVYWIRAEIHEFVIRNWRIVKVATTKAQRKLFFKLRQACKSIGSNFNTQLSEHEASVIAEELNVTPDNVREMQRRLTSHELSFDQTSSFSDDTSDVVANAPSLYLEDQRYSPEQQVENLQWIENQESQLYKALSKLDPRSRTIIQQRWLNPNGEKATLHELADNFRISAERVRQLEKQALNKLKALFGGQAVALLSN